MKKAILACALCIVAINVLAQGKLLSCKFEKADVQTVLEFYGNLTGQRVDLVLGEHQPITFELKKASPEEALQKIELTLKEQNLKLYKISDEHLVASWIKVPEKKKNEYPKRRYQPE